ncbi:hypothetical protein BN938_2677 [Mucinivorans hirudinis]|uniref:Uncharacterized protein n=1 Tax=Mucinivorans hirudinis TaxID=1433126 RepID=A0A060RAS4_9BACT|nr:hypothetical protein BN938_2677 [Mucinivorans hirudinis]
MKFLHLELLLKVVTSKVQVIIYLGRDMLVPQVMKIAV